MATRVSLPTSTRNIPPAIWWTTASSRTPSQRWAVSRLSALQTAANVTRSSAFDRQQTFPGAALGAGACRAVGVAGAVVAGDSSVRRRRWPVRTVFAPGHVQQPLGIAGAGRAVREHSGQPQAHPDRAAAGAVDWRAAGFADWQLP